MNGIYHPTRYNIVRTTHLCYFRSYTLQLSHDIRFPTMWYVQPAKAQTSLRICTVWSEPLLVAWIFFYSKSTYWTLILEFLSLKGGCTGSSESTDVKMPHCGKSHVLAQLSNCIVFLFLLIVLILTNIADGDEINVASRFTLFIHVSVYQGLEWD